MIVSRIIGGLGNQLFQYAFGFAAAKAAGVPFFLENGSFFNYPLRKYKLDTFQLDAGVVPNQQSLIQEATGDGHTTHLRGLTTVFERDFEQEPGLVPDDSFLVGYWQKYRYLQAIQGDLVRQFQVIQPLRPENLKLADRIRGSVSVAVHVRRGDYSTNRRAEKIHGLLPAAYYQTGVSVILEKVEGVRCFVFSDDPSWARHALTFPCSTEYVEHNGPDFDHEEMTVMSQCDHFVIANSTFSWWAAVLAQNPGKMVVCPQPWFSDRKMSSEGLIPPGWTQVNFRRHLRMPWRGILGMVR